MCLCLLDIAFAELQDAQVAVAFRVISVDGHCDLESLVGQAQIADADGDLADVVPHVRHVVVVGEHQSPFETTERQVVLASIEAAQAHIVPYLRVGHAVLEHPAIKPKSNFRLVSVEVVGSKARNGLGIARVELEHAFVILHAPKQRVQHVISARKAHKDVRVTHELLARASILVEGGVRLVEAEVHLAQLKVRGDRILVL
mmetsp:Transcript_61728/g.188490  ORF Transcript_61728/g.188490 Transcript_61728/m.188490 type:complete len:201 (-) Transcript_61728:407-1009(-)